MIWRKSQKDIMKWGKEIKVQKACIIASSVKEKKNKLINIYLLILAKNPNEVGYI